MLFVSVSVFVAWVGPISTRTHTTVMSNIMHLNLQYLLHQVKSITVHLLLECTLIWLGGYRFDQYVCLQLSLYWNGLLLHQSIISDPHRARRNHRGRADLLHMWEKIIQYKRMCQGEGWILEPGQEVIHAQHFDVTNNNNVNVSS